MSKDTVYEGVRAIEDNNLILVSILGIMDIVRETVPIAVEKCKKAGIKVRMVTGDNKITAEAIAKKCGIWHEDSKVMEGKDFMDIIEGVTQKTIDGEERDVIKNMEAFRDVI